MSDQNEPKSDKSRKPRSITEITLYFVLSVLVIYGCLVVIFSNQPKIFILTSFITCFVLVIGVFVIPVMVGMYRQRFQPTQATRYSTHDIRARRREARAKALGLPQKNDAEAPKHYTIGDDGQIVELKPERKRSRKPHQH